MSNCLPASPSPPRSSASPRPRIARRYAGERAQFGKTIAELPAVSRMLVSMKGEIEAARTLIFETSRWVDVLKSCELRQEEDEKAGKPMDSTLIAKKKQASNLTDMLTPLSKYYASESGNRVAYKGLQIHGGVGYMKEFNAERHVRDVRITNIYEGASQLQVVAALGKMVGRGLDFLFDQWAALDFDGKLAGDLADVKARLSSSTDLFKGCCDKLHEQERDVVDYFGSDLMDMVAAVFNSWLLLRDARTAASPGSTGAGAATAARKADLVRAYTAEQLPRSDAAGAAIMAFELTAINARSAILARDFHGGPQLRGWPRGREGRAGSLSFSFKSPFHADSKWQIEAIIASVIGHPGKGDKLVPDIGFLLIAGSLEASRSAAGKDASEELLIRRIQGTTCLTLPFLETHWLVGLFG
jgi:hypothetical protein